MKRKFRISVIAALVLSFIMMIPASAKDIRDYTDVNSNDWFYNYVKYVSDLELMTGLDDKTFGPYTSMSRAHMAVVLWRMNGSPATNYAQSYPDVTDGTFYSQASTWAFKSGVITGYTDTGNFGPADNVTREQFVTMLYRYAKYLGHDVSASSSYAMFDDGDQVSPFASTAMRWGIASGIIKGKGDGTLQPTATLNRAEGSTMISRFYGAQVNMPMEGVYANRTNGGFPNTCEIRVSLGDSEDTFRFSIVRVIDENGAGVEDVLIADALAKFESTSSSTAIYQDGDTKIEFDCGMAARLKITGFDAATELGDEFHRLGGANY